MSRIEGGALRPSLEVLDVEDLVRPTVDRLAPTLRRPRGRAQRSSRVCRPSAPTRSTSTRCSRTSSRTRRSTRPHAPIRVGATSCPDGRVRIRVEDGGPGVPPEAESRLFEKFYRVPRSGEGSRRGLGIGLGVVRGLAEAMGGEAAAGRSELGGLAVDVFLRAAPEPPGEAAEPQ